MDLSLRYDASNGPYAPDPASSSLPSQSSGLFEWSNALIPAFALTRLVRALVHRPAARLKTPSAVFPTFAPDELRYIVSFGDSYTSTRFDVGGGHPRPESPLGNPPYP